MNPLAIKCYLPGRRTQYLLQPTDDMSIELGSGADLCPRDFDSGSRVQFRLIDGQWFVSPRLGSLRNEDGGLIDGPSALSLPAMLHAESTTLVLDTIVDPRIPARLIQGIADSARQLAVAPPQPPAATRQPAVAAAVRAPSLAPLLVPSVVVQQAEKPAFREQNETRILDMAGFGAPAQAADAATESVEPTGLRLVLARLRGNRRMLAYAVLGVSLVALQFGIRRSHAAGKPAARPVVAAAPVVASAQAPEAVRPAGEVEALRAGEQPSARRAAELYAVGDYPNALRQYRALSTLPDPDPVFGVIAHALEQRLSRSQGKR